MFSHSAITEWCTASAQTWDQKMVLRGVQHRYYLHAIDYNDNIHYFFTQVDGDGAVVRNTWEDCQAGCPIEEVILDI